MENVVCLGKPACQREASPITASAGHGRPAKGCSPAESVLCFQLQAAKKCRLYKQAIAPKYLINKNHLVLHLVNKKKKNGDCSTMTHQSAIPISEIKLKKKSKIFIFKFNS